MIIASAAVLLLAGCTGQFEDFNKNPYGPTSDDMLGDNVETGVLIQAMTPAIVQGQQNNSQMIDQMIGLEFGGHAAMINPWNGTNFYTYNPSIGWCDSPFDTTMPQIYTNFFQIRDKTGGSGVVYAWAQILRVAASLKMSDCYGPIPYSKVTGGEYTVAYDDMPDLFAAMFDDLDEAITTLKAALASGADESSLSDFDYVYGGNFTKWVKYANSLKLRMAIRISNADGTTAREKAEEAVNDATGVMKEVADGAYSTFNDGMNPFYRAEYTWNNGGEFRASANLTSYMNGYQDPRLSAYFDEDINGGYNGARNGVSHTSSSFATSQETYSRAKIGQSDPLLIMSAAEVFFLRAEGKLKGWDMGEGKSARDLYEEGIKLSMDEHGATLGNYLESTNTPAAYSTTQTQYNYAAVSTVCPGWDEGADDETNLERIFVQKWIATFPSGWETWADFRRTGYPRFFPVYNNLSSSSASGQVSSDRGMRRLPYPQSEYNTNNANVTAASAMLAGTDNAATDLWWAKKQQ